MSLLYVVCQGRTRAPMLVDWVNEAWAEVAREPQFAGWQLRIREADDQNSFVARDVVSLVMETRGPVLVLGKLQAVPIALLNDRLGLRVIVTHYPDVSDPVDVYVAIIAALTNHMSGDPRVPRRLAVALMLVKKLENGRYWGGGAMAKAFLSVDELAKGRGVDEQYKDVAAGVANMLEMKGLLTKKRGDGHAKYALNSANRPAVYDFLRSWRVTDKALHKFLYGDTASISARELDKFEIQDDG